MCPVPCSFSNPLNISRGWDLVLIGFFITFMQLKKRESILLNQDRQFTLLKQATPEAYHNKYLTSRFLPIEFMISYYIIDFVFPLSGINCVFVNQAKLPFPQLFYLLCAILVLLSISSLKIIWCVSKSSMYPLSRGICIHWQCSNKIH